MRNLRSIAIAMLIGACLVATAGQAGADESDSCVWVGTTKVCVPPED